MNLARSQPIYYLRFLESPTFLLTVPIMHGTRRMLCSIVGCIPLCIMNVRIACGLVCSALSATASLSLGTSVVFF